MLKFKISLNGFDLDKNAAIKLTFAVSGTNAASYVKPKDLMFTVSAADAVAELTAVTEITTKTDYNWDEDVEFEFAVSDVGTVYWLVRSKERSEPTVAEVKSASNAKRNTPKRRLDNHIKDENEEDE